jgi:IS30 family transposase
MGLPVSKKEEDRILHLHKDGLSYETISRRMGRPARTISRVLKRLKAAAAEKQVAS